MAYISIDVDLDNFGIDEIVNCVIEDIGSLTQQQKNNLAQALSLNLDSSIKIETLDDRLKMEHISKIFHKYSTEQIEKQLPE